MIRIVIALCLVLSLNAAAQQLDNLQCHYDRNPTSVDDLSPQLSWNILLLFAEGGKQLQILVPSTPQLLAVNKGDIWDSGKIGGTATCK